MAQQIIILDKPSKKVSKKPRAPKEKAPVKQPQPKKPDTGDGRRKEGAGDDTGRKGSDLCLPNVPAPNMYKLKTLVGYEDHDVSKWREPAFTMGKRSDVRKDMNGPGPKYDLGDVTRFGTKNPLMFSLGRRGSQLSRKEMPGPSVYAPEKFEDLRFKKPPAASIKGRLKDIRKMDLPSPAEYEAPGGIGKSHPTVHKSPDAVLMSRRQSKQKFAPPAPNTYGSPNMEVVKKTAPMASISGRMPEKAPPKGPGPGAYNPQLGNARSPPAFSFGTKRSRCIEPFKEKESAASLC